MPLASHLTHLESSGLLRRARSEPELEYLFRHGLIQDAAYESLLKADRKRLHLIIGETLERLYTHEHEARELAPLLAEHFARGGDDARALHYFTLAGDAAARRYANAEVVTHYTRALAIVKDAPQLGSAPRLQDLYLRRGRALELSNRHTEAMVNYEEMERVGKECSDPALQLAALMTRATLYSVFSPLYDPIQTQALSEASLKLARELGDRAAESKIFWNLMRHTVNTGADPQQAVTYGEQSLALAREFDLREQLAFTLNDLQYAYRNVGQLAQALTVLEEAHGLWQAQNNQVMLADNLTQTALLHFYAGQFEPALSFADEAQQIGQAIHNLIRRVFSRFTAGLVYLELGQPGRAIDNLEEALRLLGPLGYVGPGMTIVAVLAGAYGSVGALDRALDLARLAAQKAHGSVMSRLMGPGVVGTLARLLIQQRDLAAARSALTLASFHSKQESLAPLFLSAAQMPLAEAELALADEEYPRAIHVLEDVIGTLQTAGIRAFLTDALYLKGRALSALGQSAEAQMTLRLAQTEAETIGARRSLWPVLSALSQIEAQRGHAAEAGALHAQAKDLIHNIADHCPPGLRESFLNLPDVKRVMSIHAA